MGGVVGGDVAGVDGRDGRFAGSGRWRGVGAMLYGGIRDVGGCGGSVDGCSDGFGDRAGGGEDVVVVDCGRVGMLRWKRGD